MSKETVQFIEMARQAPPVPKSLQFCEAACMANTWHTSTIIFMDGGEAVEIFRCTVCKNEFSAVVG